MHMGLATATQSGGGIGSLLILLLPLLLLFFLMMTQRRRMRAVTDLQQSLQVGDEVVTSSGMYGRIVAFDDPAVILQVAPGVQLRFDRRAVGGQGSPGRPVPSTPDAGAGAGDGTTP